MKTFLTPRILILILIALIASPLSAAEQSRCQRKAEKMHSDFYARLDQIEQAYSQTQTETIEAGFALSPDGTEKTRMQSYIDQLISEARLKEKRTAWSVNADDFVAAIAQKDKASGNCRRFGQLRNSIDRASSEYENHHKRLNEAIERRLSLNSLEDDEGLVIVAITLQGYSERIHLSRLDKHSEHLKFGPLANENMFQVVKMKMGRYWWSGVMASGGKSPLKYELEKGNAAVLNVMPGRVNYIGVFAIERRGASAARFEVVDHPSGVMKLYEQRYSELIGQYPLAHGLGGNIASLKSSNDEALRTLN